MSQSRRELRCAAIQALAAVPSPIIERQHADVAKLVDAPDLKSVG